MNFPKLIYATAPFPTANVLNLNFQGAMLIVVGLVLGLTAAFFCTRFLSSLLFGVGATDPLTKVEMKDF